MSTPFQNAGYTKDTKFKVISGYGIFKVGDIVVLGEDDGTTSPYMILLGTDFDPEDSENHFYMYLPSEVQQDYYPELEVIAEPCPSVASPIEDTAILEPKVYTDHQEGEVSPKASTGASVDITINITIDGNSWGITRDEAFKLFKDLKDIFEEKVI